MQTHNIEENKKEEINPKKTLFVKKLKIDTNLIKKELYDLFDNPETYLNLPKKGNKIIIGKKATGPRYDKNNKLIYFTVVGERPNLFTKKKKLYGSWIRSLSKVKNNDKNIFSERSILTRKSTKSDKIEVISKMFDYSEKLIKKNKNNPNIYSKSMPTEIRNKLKSQENKLKLRKDQELENEKIIKEIKKDWNLHNSLKQSKFLNISKKKPLLIETSNISLMKNEANSYVNRTYENRDLFQQNNWIINLRKPNHFHGKRDIFVPYGRKDNIRWALLNENLPIKKETVADPKWNTDFLKDEFNKTKLNSTKSNTTSSDEIFYRTSRTISKLNDYQNKAKKLADLEVKGHSLFELEKEHFQSLKGNFHYYLPTNKEEDDDCLKDLTIIKSYKDKTRNKPFYCKTSSK